MRVECWVKTSVPAHPKGCCCRVYKGTTYPQTPHTPLSLDEELTSRIGYATAAFNTHTHTHTHQKCVKREWENDNLGIKTKALIYQTCFLSTLVYGIETWTLYASQERRLNSFHTRCLTNILNIKWQDRIPDTEVLKRAGTQSLYPIVSASEVAWTHCTHG